MEDDRLVYVYTLSDPRDGTIRYIGATQRPETRIAGHLGESRANRHVVREGVYGWINEMTAMGLMPRMELIDVAWRRDAARVEARWIVHYMRRGHSLLNSKFPREWGLLIS